MIAMEYWHCSNTAKYKQKATIHLVTTMLATSKTVLFPDHNHLLTTGTDDPLLAAAWVIIEVSGHQYWYRKCSGH